MNLNAKLNWDISGEHKLALSYHGSRKQWSSLRLAVEILSRQHRRLQAEQLPLNASFNHVLSKSTYYTLMAGYLDVVYKGSLGGHDACGFLDGRTAPAGYIALYTSPAIDPSTGFY